MSENNSSRRRLEFSNEDGEEKVTNSNKKNKTTNAKEESSAVTPDKGIEKFVTRSIFDSKPKAARQLVTPQKDQESDFLYYESGDEEDTFKPTYLHDNVEYHRRGDFALDCTTLKVYRFIRDNFCIPNTFETDHKFGPLSGSCFEERVIRAYSLGELEPRKGTTKCNLLVCTYCGGEGHKKDSCRNLI